MKIFQSPVIRITVLQSEDVVRTSGGVKNTTQDILWDGFVYETYGGGND